MIYLWATILSVVFLFGMVHGLSQMRKRVRERIIAETKKRDGPEAARAIEAHLNGEW